MDEPKPAHPETEFWKEDAARHNELCKIARDLGLVGKDGADVDEITEDGELDYPPADES